MQCEQTIAIDLPLGAGVEDSTKAVFVDTNLLASRVT
jgi:hypothetical protein